jgi:hypothetical protein
MSQPPQRYDSYVRLADFLALKRELENFKEAATERQKLLDGFWKERLAWISLIIASWTVTVMALLRVI